MTVIFLFDTAFLPYIHFFTFTYVFTTSSLLHLTFFEWRQSHLHYLSSPLYYFWPSFLSPRLLTKVAPTKLLQLPSRDGSRSTYSIPYNPYRILCRSQACTYPGFYSSVEASPSVLRSGGLQRADFTSHLA